VLLIDFLIMWYGFIKQPFTNEQAHPFERSPIQIALFYHLLLKFVTYAIGRRAYPLRRNPNLPAESCSQMHRRAIAALNLEAITAAVGRRVDLRSVSASAINRLP
jgi:hypothetical protein